jgi:CheY-like chemotaxis protein
MTRLVDDLLDVSRIAAGRVELEVDAVDMGHVLETVGASLKPAFDAGGQGLTFDLPREPLYVHGDRIRLLQVFSNLLQNAHKYTPRGGTVRVDAERVEREVIVYVRDDGIGIPSNMLDKIFDLFAQVDPAHQRARTGLGIGLTLAKSLVELHGGRIEARSAGKDRGSEFIVRLPARTPPTVITEKAESRAATQVHRRILIADDNEDAAMSLGMLLESWGHATRTVHDGLAALKEAEAFRPDVLILDLDMPKLDGFSVARMVKAQPWAAETMLIALTGWAQEADREHGRAAGFHHHLIKPVAPDALQAVLLGAEGAKPA